SELTLEQVTQPRYVALVRVLVAEMPRVPALGSLFISAIPQEGSSVLRALFASAAAHGVISGADLDIALYLFVSSLLMHLFTGLLRPDNDIQSLPPERLAKQVRLFLLGIVHDRPEVSPAPRAAM